MDANNNKWYFNGAIKINYVDGQLVYGNCTEDCDSCVEVLSLAHTQDTIAAITFTKSPFF